jgi:hypothetical protein
MQIVRFKIEDCFGIELFEITEAGKMNLITGGNWAGKSSVIKALEHLFLGSGIKMNIVRNGADKTKLMGVLDNGLSIERTTNRASGKVTVVDGEGRVVPKPQTLLNALFGGDGLNPLKFFQAKPAERLRQILASAPFILKPEVVVKAAGELAEHLDLESVDFTPHGIDVLKGIADTVYGNRHQQNRQVTLLAKSVELERQQLPDTTDLDRFEGFDYDKASSSLQAANNAIAEHRAKESELSGLRETAQQIVDSIKATEDQLAELKKRHAEVKVNGKRLKAEVEDFEEPEVAQLRQDLSDWQQAQEVLSALKAIKRRESELQSERAKHEALDRLYGILNKDLPRQALSRMKLPMKGVAIDGDRITLNGVSLDGLSTSEQMQFAVDFAVAMIGEIGLICIDDWEHMDATNRADFIRSASKAKGKDGGNVQFFFAQVTDGKLRHEILGADPA